LKALSVRQPWAWLICRGFKDIENRDWKLPAYGFTPPGRVYIHASKKVDINATTEELILKRLTPNQREEYHTAVKNRGAIIGEVDIIDCVTESNSPWFTGKYGFTLSNPVIYDKSTPCTGKLGLFIPEIPLLSE
jgi:hypothetical protein